MRYSLEGETKWQKFLLYFKSLIFQCTKTHSMVKEAFTPNFFANTIKKAYFQRKVILDASDHTS